MKIYKIFFSTVFRSSQANWITKEWQLQNPNLKEKDIKFRQNKNIKRTWEDCGLPIKPKTALKIVCSGSEIKIH